FTNLERTINFFGSLGIPAPEIQAPFVAGVELVGGLLVLIGLFSRLASLPLILVMVVAIVTAKLDSVESLKDFIRISDVHYLLFFSVIAALGPGRFRIKPTWLGFRGGERY